MRRFNLQRLGCGIFVTAAISDVFWLVASYTDESSDDEDEYSPRERHQVRRLTLPLPVLPPTAGSTPLLLAVNWI